MLLTASPLAPFPGFSLCPPRPQTKGEAERRETRRLTRALRARGCPHPDPPPLAGEGWEGRSPLGVPLRLWPGRQLVPKALHQAMLREQSGAFSPVGRPNRGGDLALLHGRYPRRKTRTLSPYSEHLACRSCAGRLMPDAARERVTNPPAGTALAPSQGVSSRRTSLRKARWGSFSSAGDSGFKKFRRRAPSR